MNALAHFLAPFALLLPPAAMLDGAPGAVPVDAGLSAAPAAAAPAGGFDWQALLISFQPQTAQQVSIEQRITIRIAPRPVPRGITPSMLAMDAAPQPGQPRLAERRMGRCVPVNAIHGVQPAAGGRLMMVMKDNRIVSAALSKGCQSRDYYSGFLIAKNADGMICQGRDNLLARNGATCQVTGFRQIVELDD